MDSRNPRPDAPPRALDRRRGLRLFAVTLWTAFLGATLTFVFVLAWMPDGARLTLGELSVGFLTAWALAAVPIALALMLTEPEARGGR